MLKRHRYASAKASNAALVKLTIWVIKNDYVINCEMFFCKWFKPGQTSNVIWLSRTWLKWVDQWWSNVLQSCLFMYYWGILIIITDKCFNHFEECATRYEYLFLQEEEYNSSSWGESKMYSSNSIANSERMQTQINESVSIAKIRI